MTSNRGSLVPLPVPFAPSDEGAGKYLIRIKDLVLAANIGVYESERHGPQRVRINVELQVAERAGRLDDDVANVVSYDDVIDGIRSIVRRGHINLVETLAEEIAALCLIDPRSRRVRVSVEKLDVVPDAAAVGVEIERTA